MLGRGWNQPQAEPETGPRGPDLPAATSSTHERLGAHGGPGERKIFIAALLLIAHERADYIRPRPGRGPRPGRDRIKKEGRFRDPSRPRTCRSHAESIRVKRRPFAEVLQVLLIKILTSNLELLLHFSSQPYLHQLFLRHNQSENTKKSMEYCF